MALDAPELDPEESMSNLGLDSLMALELQHSLEESFGAKLPIELLMGMPTLNEFVTRLLDILAKPAASPAPEPAQALTDDSTEPRESFPPIVGA
jgi:acyl carrier protein